MVHFITFFVGLVVGVHPVELSVSGPVARVEIRLDSHTIAEIEGEPWKATVDFGPGLRPGRLEAVAFDESGSPISEDVQWLNVPRSRAEAVLVPELSEDSRVHAVTIRWSSPEFVKPRKLRFMLDGERIKADENGRIDLSEVDPGVLHLLEAELSFPDNVAVREQLVFGKGAAGTVNLDLTAVPVLLDRDDMKLEAGDLTGIFLVDGAPVEVADVEHGKAQLIVVRGPSVNPQIEDLVSRIDKKRFSDRNDRFANDVALRVIGTIPHQGPRGTDRLFPFSEAQPIGRKGLARTLEKARFADLEFGLRMLNDAVALAGLRAASGNQRRAVLLMLGEDPDDVSTYPADHVRSFLRDLAVPLVVFDMTGGSETAESWRPTEDVSDPRRWLSAVRWLREDLENQRIVWLVGKHLLKDIELSPEAEGIELLR